MTIFNIHYPTSLLPYLVLDPVVLLALLYHQFCRAQVIAIDTRCWTESSGLKLIWIGLGGVVYMNARADKLGVGLLSAI